MTWNEIIHIRAHSPLEARALIETFHDLSLTQRNKNLLDIVLMKNRNVVGDFTIKMTWQGDLPKSEKSPLGYQLVEAFSKMGWINHSVWIRETSLFLQNGRSVNEKN